MKRCPKCNRTYPDDNQKFCTWDGGLLASSTFDPNATIQSVRPPTPEPEFTRDLAATVLSSPSPTGDVPRPTGPTGSETVFDRPAPSPPPPTPQSVAPPPPITPPRPPSTPPPPPTHAAATAGPAKKSKLGLILGILLLLLVLGVGALAMMFIFVIKPRLDEAQGERPAPSRTVTNNNSNANDNANTSAQTAPSDTEAAPPNTTRFVNSSSNLDGRLAEHYLDFSFYYPNGWQTDPKAGVPGASNFVKVERRLPPDFTQENFAVGWYTSKGTFEADEATFPQLVEILGSSLARGFPEYRKVSEGPTKVNSLDAYEFRFVSVSKGTEKGDIDLWGRVIFLPTGVAGEKAGATLILLATSLAPELSGVDDVGEKGEMPVILETFKFGRQ